MITDKNIPPEAVLHAYDLSLDHIEINPIGTGLINHTWKLKGEKEQWILQKINTSVFPEPEKMDDNIQLLAAHLKLNHADYLFTEQVQTKSGKTMVKQGDDYYRLFVFIPDSHTITVVDNEHQAKEAAFQFGNFTRQFTDLDCLKLKITIEHFHDLSFRYQQFLEAVNISTPERMQKASQGIEFLKAQDGIVKTYFDIMRDPEYKLRVTHHDTKISNVLFNKEHKGLCVIDLDTVMPGYFFSDLGDMFRTYLSPVSEEEKKLDLITVRPEIYRAIVDGYTKGMGTILTNKEQQHFYYAGLFMIYMQALRFLTDYLNGDIYYPIQYAEHNLSRAQNQITLLQAYLHQRKELEPYQLGS